MGQVLTFRLGEERYGLEMAKVQEIIEAPRFYYIPLAPPCYLGAINFHGTILPVLDLGGLPGVPRRRAGSADDRAACGNLQPGAWG